MSAAIDLFDNPKALLATDFNPYSCSVLGICIGSPASVLKGWETEDNEYGWSHMQGGVAFRIRQEAVYQIKLPFSFFQRLDISAVEELIRVLGKNDDVREFGYRDRLLHRGYLWNRGIIFWWEILPVIKPWNVTMFDPKLGYPHYGKDVTYTLVEGGTVKEPKPPFEIPSVSEREHLKIGYFVKLIFRITIDSKSFNERMWVKVTEIKPEYYEGFLANDPYCTNEIKCGLRVQFHSGHVIQIASTPPIAPR